MRVIGPNCLGVMSPAGHVNATFAASMALPGHVAFLSQSGALLHGSTRLAPYRECRLQRSGVTWVDAGRWLGGRYSVFRRGPQHKVHRNVHGNLMTIATRLTLLLAVPLLILAGLGLFIVYQLNNIEKKGRFVAVDAN